MKFSIYFSAFRFQFAASQWQLLVTSAENILVRVLQNDSTSPVDKAEVESWLCMKAEADECIGLDLLRAQSENAAHRPLDVIG